MKVNGRVKGFSERRLGKKGVNIRMIGVSGGEV
jgi:hypothetical protein